MNHVQWGARYICPICQVGGRNKVPREQRSPFCPPLYETLSMYIKHIRGDVKPCLLNRPLHLTEGGVVIKCDITSGVTFCEIL